MWAKQHSFCGPRKLSVRVWVCSHYSVSGAHPQAWSATQKLRSASIAVTVDQAQAVCAPLRDSHVAATANDIGQLISGRRRFRTAADVR